MDNVSYSYPENFNATGDAIHQAGVELGDAVGSHGWRILNTPDVEQEIVQEAVDETASALLGVAKAVFEDPLGAFNSAKSAGSNYLDQVTSDPKVSGNLMGGYWTTWATMGASGAANSLRSAANGLKSLRALKALKWGGLKNLGDDIVGELFDGQKLDKILANHLKNGGSLITGDDAVRMLKSQGAGALYLPRAGGPGTLIFGPNATRLQVLEELIHHGQYKRIGFPELDSIKGAFVGTRFEIEAQDILLDIARRKGWTQAEIELITRNRAAWIEDFEDLIRRYGDGY